MKLMERRGIVGANIKLKAATRQSNTASNPTKHPKQFREEEPGEPRRTTNILLGKATLNGAVPPIDTEVVAMEGSTKLGSTMTMAGGKFTLNVMRPPGGGMVTCMVGGVDASERLSDWTFGKIQPNFNLPGGYGQGPGGCGR